MINPRILKPQYTKFKSRYGAKFYVPVAGRMCRRGKNYLTFKIASEAQAYALKVHKRWMIEYDRTISFQATVKVKDEELELDSAYAAVIANADAPTEEAKG